MNESRTLTRARKSEREDEEGGLHSEGRQVPRRREKKARKTSLREVGESING